MPFLPSDRARRDDGLPPDSDAPLVLTRLSGSSLILDRCCPHARRLGLRPGMTLGQAQAIAPHLRAIEREQPRERALLHQLAAWAMRFSPVVEPVEPDTLLLDVTGCARLFRGEANIARQAVAGLARQGIGAQAAIADTVGGAYALAYCGTGFQPVLLAQASHLCTLQPAYIVVPAGQTSAYIAPLPPAALRIEPRTSDRLLDLGVRTVGDLLMLPRSSLPSRFGQHLVLRIQQALGEVFEGIAVHRPEDPPAARVVFETALQDLRAIQAALSDLLQTVLDEVLRAEAVIRKLDCVLYCENAAPVMISIGLSRGSRSRRHIWELIEKRLERVDLSAGICAIVLTARETSPWRAAQGDLYEPRSPQADEDIGRLIDRVANRLGYGAVLRPRLIDDHQPEMAFRYVCVAEAGLGVKEGAEGENERDRGNARPLQLLSRPAAIRVIALAPDGPPTWMSFRGREHVIARASGPERIETAWWRGGDVRRDYFRVTSESGEQFWVFRELNERGWYLHGMFA